MATSIATDSRYEMLVGTRKQEMPPAQNQVDLINDFVDTLIRCCEVVDIWFSVCYTKTCCASEVIFFT